MLVLIGIGLFLSILILVYNKGYKSANVYLGLFLFLSNLVIFSLYLYIFSNSKVVLAYLLSIPINPLVYTLGPLAYLYVRAILSDNAKFTKYDVLHFVIFAINLIGRLPYNLAGWEEKLRIASDIVNLLWESISFSNKNNVLPVRINSVLKGIHFLFYVIIIWGLIFKNKFDKSSFGRAGNQLKIVNNWLFFFVMVITFLAIFLVLIVLLFLVSIGNRITFQYEGNILFSFIFIGLITLILGHILFPQILYGIPIEKLKLDDNKIEHKELIHYKTRNNSFDEDYSNNTRLLLENWKKGNKFLDIDASIYKLAEEINFPVHHVIYYFNKINHEKYIDWRNRLRVEYGIGLINNQKDFNKTIDILGVECGFRSYATFIHSFKKVTGKLPKDYIKDSKKELLQ